MSLVQMWQGPTGRDQSEPGRKPAAVKSGIGAGWPGAVENSSNGSGLVNRRINPGALSRDFPEPGAYPCERLYGNIILPATITAVFDDTCGNLIQIAQSTSNGPA